MRDLTRESQVPDMDLIGVIYVRVAIDEMRPSLSNPTGAVR